MSTEFSDAIIPIIAIGLGGVVAILCIIAGTIKSVCRTRNFEASRREIAAYIAEGSMTPEDGQRLLSERA